MRGLMVVWALAGAAACGASPRMVHQARVYFERCHAAEHDGAVSQDARRRCWAAWLEHYGRGEEPDRVAYAEAAARQTGPVGGAGPALAASDGDRRFGPDGAGAGSAPAPVETRVDATSEAPFGARSACERVCAPRLDRCRAACAGGTAGCMRACEGEARVCARGCFQ